LHYYQFNIGDYASHTRHLTRDEDLAYRRILDLYYLQEKPLPKEPQDVARLILMNDCSTDVQRVLNEFFVLGENGWENKRANEEISKFHSRSKQASDAGKASAEARKQRTLNGRSTDVQLNKKQETRNIKQETNKNIGRQAAVVCPDGVDEMVWKDFLSTRKAKLTETALNGIIRESQKAGWSLQAALQECTMRGWRGFKADWVSSASKLTQHQKNQAATARALFGSATPSKIIDMEDGNEIITRRLG
jgi:uncharacterized protein YdaU (DUF1376 family)